MLHCNKTPDGGNVSADPQKDRSMSPQLTLSSLFSVLALAGLCIVTSVQDRAGAEAPVTAEFSASTLEG